jgi:hypothetical protein
VDWFERRKIARSIGILLCLLAGILGLSVFRVVPVPTVRHIIERITTGVPQLIDLVETRGLPWLEDTFGWQAPASVDEALTEYELGDPGNDPGCPRVGHRGCGRRVDTHRRDRGEHPEPRAGADLHVLLSCGDFDRMKAAAREYLPEHNRDWVLERFRLVRRRGRRWFRGQMQVPRIIACSSAIGSRLSRSESPVWYHERRRDRARVRLLNIIPYFGFAVEPGSRSCSRSSTGTRHAAARVLITFAIGRASRLHHHARASWARRSGSRPFSSSSCCWSGGELLGLLGFLLALPIAGALGVLMPT